MTSTAVQQPVSIDDVKQALYALIEGKNPEFLRLITHELEKKLVIAPKKAKKKTAPKIIFPPKKERMPYSEMPFWKANLDLKPRELPEKSASSKDFLETIKDLQELFKDVSEEEWENWLECLKDDR